MKKIFLTSIITITIVAPAFGAVGDKTINAGANSAPCTSATLDTPTGPAALEADWTANTIRINWDAKNGTTIPQTQCTYDDTITLPATPSKTGYTFGGWTVAVSGGTPTPQQQNCFANLSSLDYVDFGSTQGQNATWWRDLVEWHYDEEYEEEVASDPYGRLTGISKCSSTPGGDWGETGNPSDENGQSCWCKVTGYTPNGSETCTPAVAPWVFNGDLGDAEECGYMCSSFCADNGTLFGAAAQ